MVTGETVKWQGIGGKAYEGIIDNIEDGMAWVKISEHVRAFVSVNILNTGNFDCRENLKGEIMNEEEKTENQSNEEAVSQENISEETTPESNVVTAESLKKRKSYGRKKWTPEEDEKLLTMYKEGKKRPEMCETFGVKDGAIRSRLYWFKITGKLN